MQVKYLVATLPFSNAYFAKAYAVERLESLLDGIECALRWFGGVVDRVVLDNTSLAVKNVLAGRDRVVALSAAQLSTASRGRNTKIPHAEVVAELAKHTRKPDQEWVRMLRLMETYPAVAVERAVRAAFERHSPRLETVRLILRQQEAGPPPVCPPVTDVRPELARIAVPTPTLSAYDALVEGVR